MKTIVLGTDGSPGAKRATREAIALALDTGWPLRIVSVWSVPALELSAAPMMAGELAEVSRDNAQGRSTRPPRRRREQESASSPTSVTAKSRRRSRELPRCSATP
jgi:nucleotide-binding universal stress UspA family protein